MMPQPHPSIPSLLLGVLCASIAVVSAEPDARFRHFDNNGDGRLTADEFPYPVVFKQHDTDGDGFLSPQEVQKIPTTRAKPASTAPPAAS